MPWRRFIVADVIAGVVWASYAALLGYVGGKQFEEEPWKGLVLAFVVAIGIALTVELIRNRRAKRGASS
jgi:membrane protein DedA with SNARE-associated domain